MRIPRSVTYRIRRLLDEWTPPAIRDRRFFTWLPARLVIGRDADLFLDFKDRALGLTEEEFSAVYRTAHHVVIQRETDLTAQSLEAVLRSLQGESVLEVGCGGGYLADRMSRTHPTTAVDIYLDEEAPKKYPKVKFLQAPVTQLPFPDASFDTVVSTHVLEHVQDITSAMRELRRVCKRRLIIVVPRQRPYRYTFDLHLHFFPYEYTLIAAVNPVGPYTCRDLGGDWVYIEEVVAPRESSSDVERADPPTRGS